MSRSLSLSSVARQVAPTDFATASAHEDVFCDVYEGERAHIKSYSRLNAPHLPSAGRQVVFSRLHYDIAPMRLFALRNACFYGSPIFFASEAGELVKESTEHWHKEQLDVDTFLGHMRGWARGTMRDFYSADGVIRPSRSLPGAYALGCSRYDSNYYHWHVDILPTVLLLQTTYSVIPSKILIARDVEYIQKSLAYLGVAPERIVKLPNDEPVVVERLIFASSMENHALYMHRRVGDVFRAIKERVLEGSAARPARKVFVSRGNSTRRRLVNRTAVEERFAGLGFEVVDPGTLSYEAQVRLFAEADLVVGEHGGGLGNIGFCQPETLVIELFHPRHNDLCYLGLAETQGLLHQIFVGTDTNNAARGQEAEWAVDVEAAVDFVQRVAAEREWYRCTRRN